MINNIEEIENCKNDIVYFVENYMKFDGKNIKLTNYQKYILHYLQSNPINTIILSNRQVNKNLLQKATKEFNDFKYLNN